MNSSMFTSDRVTHLKIGMTAAFAARVDTGSTIVASLDRPPARTR